MEKQNVAGKTSLAWEFLAATEQPPLLEGANKTWEVCHMNPFLCLKEPSIEFLSKFS